MSDISKIRSELQQMFAEAIEADPRGAHVLPIPDDVPILDLGINSLALVEGIRRVYDQFGVLVSIRRVLEGQVTLGELALYIDQELSRSPAVKNKMTAPRQWKEEQNVSLAESQRHVGFLCRYSDEASTAYNESLALLLKGSLDGPALQAAIEEVGNRYEALRTTLNQDSDSLSIGAGQPMELVVSAASEKTLEQDLDELVSRPFELGKRFFRAELLRLSENEHILVLVGHSLVLEHQALEFILNEVIALYEIFARNGEATVAPPVIQWKDYLAMGNSVEAKEAQVHSELYWKEVFASGVPQLEIPSDHPRPAVKKYSGSRVAVPLEATLEGRMYAWAKAQGIKPEALLFAAFSGFLHRLSDQKDLVVGVESEPLYPGVGIRTIARTRNMLPIRTIFDPYRSFQDHVRAQLELLENADANKHLSFAELIQLLHLPTDQSRSALFTVAFRCIKQGVVPGLEALETSLVQLPSAGARYDLEMIVVFTKTGSWLVCDYSTELFEKQTVSRWLQGYQAFLNSGLENSAQTCGLLAMMPDDEKDLVLYGWNRTEKFYPNAQTVLDRIVEQAQECIDRPALRFGEKSFNYGQLLQRIEQIAGVLQARGVTKGEHVGILLRRSLDLVPTMLAVWRVGALFVPMDTGFPKKRLAYMVSNAKVRVVITNRDALSLIEDTGIQSLCIEDIGADVGSTLDPTFPASASDSAMILFTSGSTGKPKGVEIRHGALLNCLLATKDYLEFSAQSCMLAITTISFDISSNELLMPLLAGGCVDIGEDGLGGDGIRMSELIETRNPSHVQATVSTLKAVLTAGWKGNPEICLVSSGEALGRETAEQLLQKSRCLWNFYGPTETTVYSSAYQVRSAPGKPMQIGRPLPNTQMYILDQLYQPVPSGAIGELYIGGDGMAVGYWQIPELTNERFVTNPFRPGEKMYKTGDLARYLPDGSIVCLGRIDDQVKIHGVRVEPGEIEAVLRNVPGIKDAVVVSWTDPRGDAQLVGHLIANENANLSGPELRIKLREQLPETMIPSFFIFHKKFALTANGKVHRASLPPPNQEWQKAGESTHLETPSTPTEQALAKIWAGVLGIDAKVIGRESDFIDLGGHSLLMTLLLLEVREQFQVNFKMRELFSAATLRKFAAFIDERQPREADKQNDNWRLTSPRSNEWARQRMTFLQREAQLPGYIAPARGLIYRPQELRKVFFTGATGFLGAYIVAEILNTTNLELFCLVRPKRSENSKDRIEKQMRRYEVWSEDEAWHFSWNNRMHVVEGDVTLPRMGIANPVYERLAIEIDAILHGAAHVNFIYPYEALRATNVLGLQEIIQFAFYARIKPVHHISTAAVWPMGSQYTYYEKDSIDHNGALNLGYDEAKWVGEKSLIYAAERGLPVARYRPGEVGGDSITGHCVTNHFIFACLKGFLQFGAFPELDIEVDVAPVDYVAKALVYLLVHRNPINRAFHLTNPDRRRMRDALAFLRTREYQFEEMPFEDLRDSLVNSPNFSQNALFAYQAVLEDMDNLSMELPTYDTSQTRRGLEGSGIFCPPADEKLLDTYLGYLQQIGFIPLPETLFAQI